MQLQQATVALCSYLLAWEAQLSPRKSVQDQIHMCGPKHTQLWVMCLRGRQLRPKERERSVHPHTNSHDTHGYDSPDPEELNSKVHGEFASPWIWAFVPFLSESKMQLKHYVPSETLIQVVRDHTRLTVTLVSAADLLKDADHWCKPYSTPWDFSVDGVLLLLLMLSVSDHRVTQRANASDVHELTNEGQANNEQFNDLILLQKFQVSNISFRSLRKAQNGS